MERIQVINGKRPVVLVAPHGVDDTRTGDVAVACAKALECSAVINWGFRRDTVVDVIRDRADCNKVDHAEQDVVREEFLEPILSIRKRVDYLTHQDKSPYCYIFHLHGFGLQVERGHGREIDLILGYGESHLSPSLTCPHWVVDKFIYEWEHATGGLAFCGEPGGRYSARNANNMCQYFTRHRQDSFVRSMQIEISQRLRATKSTADRTGCDLADSLQRILAVDHFDGILDRLYI